VALKAKKNDPEILKRKGQKPPKKKKRKKIWTKKKKEEKYVKKISSNRFKKITLRKDYG
jgi:hypothetical protein